MPLSSFSPRASRTLPRTKVLPIPFPIQQEQKHIPPQPLCPHIFNPCRLDVQTKGRGGSEEASPTGTETLGWVVSSHFRHHRARHPSILFAPTGDSYLSRQSRTATTQQHPCPEPGRRISLAKEQPGVAVYCCRVATNKRQTSSDTACCAIRTSFGVHACGVLSVGPSLTNRQLSRRIAVSSLHHKTPN